MPNAMQRSKTNPLIKLEKNNENIDLRRRLNVAAARERPTVVTNRGGGSRIHPEPFWERLSRVKRVPSQTNLTEFGGGSQLYLLHGSSQSRIPPQRSCIPHPQKPFKKQTTVPKVTADSNKAVGRKPIAKKELAFTAPPQLTPKIGLSKPVKKIKEILQARSVCTSNTSSDFINVPPCVPKRSSPCENSSEYFSQPSNFNYTVVTSKGISRESSEEYEMPPLIKVPTTDSFTSSVNIRNDFIDLLEQRNCSMEPDEISVIKNVVKVDERHHNLQRNDSQLFKSILRSQLKEILKQEIVVKNALTKLEECASDHSKISDDSQPEDEILPEEPKINVTFENVPTLEKEIIIIKALGERLEATLHRSGPKRLSSRSDGPNVANPLQMRKMVHIVCVDHANYPQIVVRSFGIRMEKSYVREFRIARKTIVELKENAGKHFYLPADDANNELKRTSFRKLKENPDILMRHLKPKNSLVPFNVLDHDPIFFNSFLHNMNPTAHAEPNKSDDETSKLDECSDDISSEGVPIREGGDSTIYKQTRLEAKCKEDKPQLPAIWDDEDDDLEEEPEGPKYGLMQQRKKLREIKEKEFKIWEVGPDEFQNETSELSNVKEIDAKKVQTKNEINVKKGKSSVPQKAVPKSKPKTKKKKKEDHCQSGDSKEEKDKKIEADIPLEKPKSKDHSPSTPAKDSESKESHSVLFQSPLRGTKRRRIRRGLTPLPMEKEIEPKNHVIKTILVGVLQVSVFLILIMAITFPDIRCF